MMYIEMPIYVISSCCPECGQGLVVFRTCHDKRIVLLCDECDLAWLNPEQFKGKKHTYLVDGVIADTNSSVNWAGSHCSTKEEIIAVGWGSYIEEEIMIKVKKPK